MPDIDAYRRQEGARRLADPASRHSVGTGGDWTKILSYDPSAEEATIRFADGFVATYPNIDAETYQSMRQGATAKTTKAPQSVGAWLWQHPGVMRNYR